MRAVTNSSILIALSTIGQLQLLNQRFPDRVLMPRAVQPEVVETGVGHFSYQLSVISYQYLCLKFRGLKY
ncbi:MAG: hypothetical protein F6K17_37375 [Okeania sp. SIO3C4]|nr:hypothetical protein [Okeania sp. SIO3B3]NER07829.1 hypothetical protein [Okeania sp. SIO3C4]